MNGLDHGALNLPLHKRGAGSLDAQIDRWRAERAREARERQKRAHAARVGAREAEKARTKLTADDVRGAVAVRDQHGWHRVVRVSAKSVTVETGYSWTDRIPLEKLLEARGA